MNPDEHDHPPQPWEAIIGAVLIAVVLAGLITMFVTWNR